MLERISARTTKKHFYLYRTDCLFMQQEIEKALLRLKIEARDVRKRMVLYISIFSILVAFCFLVPYFYPKLSALETLGIFILLFGGLYVLNEVIPTLHKPLAIEDNTFKKIANIIQILEKSNEPIAYRESYRRFKDAHKTFTEEKLSRIKWYRETNEVLDQFRENLELIVLPAISDSSIKIEHLEEIALAIYHENPEGIKAINKTLESSYKKHPKPPRKIETYMRRFRESVIGKLLYSLALGYGVVLIICLIYVVATQQNFMIFARENPEIVVLGGLFASGITFWKTKLEV